MADPVQNGTGAKAKRRRGIVPGNRSLHDFIMREAAACSRMKPKDPSLAPPKEKRRGKR